MIREKIEIASNGVWGAVWVVDAPWAHPFWNQYVVYLYDLTTPIENKPVLYKEGVTHEVIVYAADPRAEFTTELNWNEFNEALLQPANMGYQFYAENNDEAYKRIKHLVESIDQRALNPDTDFRSQWDALFHDGVSLMRDHFNA